MKLLFFLFFISSNFVYSANTPEEMLKRGNQYFLSGDFSKSIEIYQKLVKQGYTSSTLFYNLANAYFRAGKIGLSILYYEKAKIYSPFDEDILHNLKFVNLQTKDKIDKLPKLFLLQWFESILNFLSINQFTLLAYFLFILILISILIYIISSNIKIRRIGFYSSILSLILFLFIAVILAVKIYQHYHIVYGVILSPTVIVKSSPDPVSKDSFIIHEGLKVKIEDQVDKWIKIKLEDGKIGWITNNDIGII